MAIREEMKGLIVEAISSCRDEILDFTKTLVSIPTENPPGASYLACVEAIVSKLREIGLDSTTVEVPDAALQMEGVDNHGEKPYPRYCLLSFYGEGERTLYFHGHYDVVPAQSEAQFRPYVEGGKLFDPGLQFLVGLLIHLRVLDGHGGLIGEGLS